MPKNITFSKSAMDSMIIGLDIAANAVKGTIGPKGLNVYFDDPYTPEITNDGVTIASKIILEDKQQDAGAYIIRNVSGQQNDDVGDGTTTVVTLTHAIIHECLKRPENPMEIKASLKEAGEKVLKQLAKQSISLKKQDIQKVAYISAENTDIAKLITEIIGKLGEKAIINVEDSKTFVTDYEIVDGYETEVGFLSPHFINEKKSGKAIYTDIPVLVTEKKISNIVDISGLFDQFKANQITNCVIVCDDIDDAMLGMFVMNKNMGTFNILIIKAHGDTLKDIEGVTGAKMVSDATGVTFKNLELSDLGIAKKIVCDANKTLFLGNGDASREYAQLLEQQTAHEPNMYLEQKNKERIAKLMGGVATLRIAAPTDAERSYLKRKAEDAVKATQAALSEGVVEGGGMALWRLSLFAPKTIGEEILKKAMTAPLRTIIENAGKDYTEVLMNMPKSKGYDAKNDCYTDMFTSGILDPTKVERCALENAISTASIFITTFCVITELNVTK